MTHATRGGEARQPRLALVAAGVLCLFCTACGEDGDSETHAQGGAAGSGSGGSGGSSPSAGAVLPCAPGELPLTDGSCLPPGVPEDGCGPGFAPDGTSACLPVLPTSPCGEGEMALPGETQCRPVAPCSAAKWGDIPVDATTQYVDASYGGGSSDGSAQRPWTSVQAGVDAAQPDAVVAIAAGSYGESVVVDQPVTLWGVCPANAQISGSSGLAAVSIEPGATGAEIRDLGITGEAQGVAVSGVADVLLDRVWIHHTGGLGLWLQDETAVASVALRGSLVESAAIAGAHAMGGSLSVEQCVIRSSLPDASGQWGRAISVTADPVGGQRATLEVRGSDIASNRELGIAGWGADMMLEDTVVRATQPRDSDQGVGAGVYAAWDPATGLRASLRVVRSVVDHNHYAGVWAQDGDLHMEQTVVRETQPQAMDDGGGYGVRIVGNEPLAGPRPVGIVRQSVIDGNRVVGLVVMSAQADIESVIVRDTQGRQVAEAPLNSKLGRGVSVEIAEGTGARSSVAIRGSLVERSHETGLLILGSEATIDSTAVREVESDPGNGMFGTGITFQVDVRGNRDPADGTIERSVVQQSRGAGVAVLGADVTLADVMVSDVRPQEYEDNLGDGIVVSSFLVLWPDLFPTRLQATRVTVRNSARAGVASFASDVSLGTSLLDCNTIQLDGEEIEGEAFTFEDRGGNECRCGAQVDECRILTTGLSPPGM